MNINLLGAGSKKQGGGKSGKDLGFGLNKRKKPTSNVFDNDDDDDDDDDDGDDDRGGIGAADSAKSRRDAVNREIAAEQEALRKRAMKAISSSGDRNDNNLYDYDGAYDSFKPSQQEDAAAEKKAQEEERKSRYIQDLLKQSQKRALEREAIYERKVAREQAEEDAQADFRGKEKFVTKAYKRRLEERQRLAAEDAKQQQDDELADVTKKTGGAALANFYGNLNRNVAMGGGGGGIETTNDKESMDQQEQLSKTNKDALAAELGFMQGFERAGSDDNEGEADKERDGSNNREADSQKVDLDPAAKRLAMRKARAEKLAQARTRYFQRNGMPLEGVS